MICAAGAAASQLIFPTTAQAVEPSLTAITPYLEKVLAEHPRSHQARSDVERARAEAEVLAQPLYNPELGFSGEHKRTPAGTDSGTGETTWTRVVEVSLTTDFGAKQQRRSEIGTQGVDVANAGEAEARLALVSEALTRLARYQGALDKEALAARQEAAMASFMRLAERQRKAGDSSAADLSLARLALAETARLRADARVDLARAREEVRGLCACVPDEIAQLPPQLPIEDAVVGEDIDRVLDRHPILRGLRARVEVARSELRLSEEERIPDPTFRLGGGSEGDATLVTFGVSVPIPVLNSGSAKVRASGRGLVTAEAAEATARREIATELAAARASYVEAHRGWRMWRDQAMAPIEQQAALMERMWLGGEITATDYFIQIRETARVAQQGSELKTSAWTSLATVLKASNGFETFMGLAP
ncbi:TolC family protein [Magnetospirillum fulvum]|uniref:Outer membrane protein n=1 Tax=Magnetospirillum fulvum MGU-K5 TaxID=1316936 RepID=S9SA60_MAGFU|nr:TolC family protein [Magnetospirillum fulvum]EPY00958.1 Outer membrane protein [Magnetospirillum fulvum MGU-K5]